MKKIPRCGGAIQQRPTKKKHQKTIQKKTRRLSLPAPAPGFTNVR